MIKTINLTADEEYAVNLTGGEHAIITNLGETEVYISTDSGIVADADGVKVITGGSADIMRNIATYKIQDGVGDYFGNLYLLGDGKVQIETTNNANFRLKSKGGGDGSVNILTDNEGLLCIMQNDLSTYIGDYEEVSE